MRLEKELTWKDIRGNMDICESAGRILRDWAVIARNKEQRAAIRGSKRFYVPARYTDFDRSFYRLCEITASLPLFFLRDGGGKWLLGQYAEHDMEQLRRIFGDTRRIEKTEPLFAEIILKLDAFSRLCKSLLSGGRTSKEAAVDE